MLNMSRKQVLKLCAGLALLPLAGCAKPRESGYAQRTGFFFNTVCTMGGNVSSSVLDEAEDLFVGEVGQFKQRLSGQAKIGNDGHM